MQDELRQQSPAPGKSPPDIVGDVVFGGMESPVAVCTLGSRVLLPELAGRPEIAVAGRVFTENIGVERMIQNLAGFQSIRYLIVCGRETRHKVGQTILALHRFGLDQTVRVIGSVAPDPQMPNLTSEQLRMFQTRVSVVDMIGEADVDVILGRARTLATQPPTAGPSPKSALDASDSSAATVERIVAVREPTSAWVFDPIGYFLVFVDRTGRKLRVEQYTQAHRLERIVEGTSADDISHTI